MSRSDRQGQVSRLPACEFALLAIQSSPSAYPLSICCRSFWKIYFSGNPSKRRDWRWIVVLSLLLALLAVGCNRSTPYRQVSLTPAIQETPTLIPAAEVPALRVAVAAILSPQSTSHGYDPLVAYLAKRLDRPVELVQRGTYAETNEMLHTRQVDLAFVCTGAYVQGQRDFGVELLAIPEAHGETRGFEANHPGGTFYARSGPLARNPRLWAAGCKPGLSTGTAACFSFCYDIPPLRGLAP